MASSRSDILGIPAVRLVLARLGKSDLEEDKLLEKLEKSCRNFDHSGKGSLTADEYYNVIKLQNGIDISKDEVKSITAPLPKDKDGKMKIDDFLHRGIQSAAAFKVIDRNNDGYISKAELKLAKKSLGMKEIDQVMRGRDANNDGKLDLQEFEQC